MTLAIQEPTRNCVRDFDNPLELSPAEIVRMRESALRAYPEEMCGLIVDSKWVEAKNISPEPLTSWLIDQDFQSQFDIQGVVHSHCKPYRPEPSKEDMEHQIEDGNPWGIVYTDGAWASKPLWWGDFRLEEPLIGRKFVHGVKDCYSAIRSWYWQRRGILLPDVPRNFGWWEDKNRATEKSLYSEGIGKLGYRISRDEVQVGDVALFQFLSKVPHHAAVVIENGLLYHHLESELSGRTPLGNYQKFAVAWLRYKEPA